MSRPAGRSSIFRLALALALSLGGVMGLASSATAQLSVSVTPSILELQAEPGASGQQTIGMQIDGSEGATVAAEITVYDETLSVPSAVDWLSLDTTETTVEPQGEASFTLDIAIPDDATSGGHYAAVTLTVGAASQVTPVAGESTTSVEGRFIVPVLIRVGDEDDFEVTASLDRLAPVLEQDGRIGIWAEVTNSGNVDVRAPGSATLEDASGELVAELEFPNTTPILPGETQIVRATGTLPLDDETEYRVGATIDYGGDDPAEAEATFSVAGVEPTGDLDICENLDRGPSVYVRLENGGELGFTTQVGLTIEDASGNQVVAAAIPDLVLLWPGGSQDVTTTAPTRLESGTYTLSAEILTGIDGVTTIEMPFEIGGTSELTAPLCSAATI